MTAIRITVTVDNRLPPWSARFGDDLWDEIMGMAQKASPGEPPPISGLPMLRGPNIGLWDMQCGTAFYQSILKTAKTNPTYYFPDEETER